MGVEVSKSETPRLRAPGSLDHPSGSGSALGSRTPRSGHPLPLTCLCVRWRRRPPYDRPAGRRAGAQTLFLGNADDERGLTPGNGLGPDPLDQGPQVEADRGVVPEFRDAQARRPRRFDMGRMGPADTPWLAFQPSSVAAAASAMVNVSIPASVRPLGGESCLYGRLTMRCPGQPRLAAPPYEGWRTATGIGAGCPMARPCRFGRLPRARSGGMGQAWSTHTLFTWWTCPEALR